MFRRQISFADVEEVVRSGRVLECYPSDVPYPSQLILGVVKGRPLHVVAADDPGTRQCIIITAYEPHLDRWRPGFKRRRQ